MTSAFVLQLTPAFLPIKFLDKNPSGDFIAKMSTNHTHKGGKELLGFINYSFNRSLSLIFDFPGTFSGLRAPT